MKLKVKVGDFSAVDIEKLDKINRLNLERAKEIYKARPFVTKLWFRINTTFPHTFIDKNWEKITNEN